ncbi:glycosyltransferase [Candidatus Woesearchaeota archaeon]|nr:glycosyltransferase [Candidatus Woesearchaeota archaeon]
MSSSIFAIIAARNEERNIYNIIKKTMNYVDKVIVVDDGSVDFTKKEAEKAGAVVLRHIINLGKGAALKTGCRHALSRKADIIVLIDADGQHKPEDIPKFLEKLKNNDIVFGIRKRNKNMPLLLRFGNWGIDKVSSILYSIDIPDTQCGFRAFKADIYKKIKWQSPDYSMESEMVANVGKKNLKYSTVTISTIYSDKYKGTTISDGIKIVLNLFWWKLSRK